MARPNRNGVEKRAVTTPRTVKASHLKMSRSPIGNAPKDLAPDERKMWDTIIDECPWVDRSHRRFVRGLALAAARVDRITEYFRKRQVDYKKNGYDVALAYLDDNGKRHPLMTDLLAAEECLRKALSALGASPAAQVRMLSDMGNEQANAKEEENKQRFFK